MFPLKTPLKFMVKPEIVIPTQKVLYPLNLIIFIVLLLLSENEILESSGF